MKNLKGIVLVILFFQFGLTIVFSQPVNNQQKQADDFRGPLNVLPGGVIDGVVLKEELPIRSKIEYEHVRLADYVWSKRVFSRIDAKEKMNFELFLPYDDFNQSDYKFPSKRIDVESDKNWLRHQERLSLWTIIYKHILLGDITVYNVASASTPYIEDGYQLKYPIVKNNSDDFFNNANYRKDVSKALSFGASGGFMTIPDPNNKPLGLLPISKGFNPTFQAWVDSLTIMSPTSKVDPSDDDPTLTVYDQLGIWVGDVKKRKEIEDAWNVAKNGDALKSPGAVFYINSRSIMAYNIKEDWFFDKERSILDRRIIAIAPVGNYLVPIDNSKVDPYEGLDRFANFLFVDIDGKLKKLETDPANPSSPPIPQPLDPNSETAIQSEMFWLYFPELRNVIVNYYIYNDKSDAQWMSFDDLFWKRKFSAMIYKTSDKFDRDVEDYRYGVDALYEAEKIKEEIRKWEHDVWNF